MSAGTAAKPRARKAAKKTTRRERKLEIGESRVEWVEEDSSAARVARARVSKLEQFTDDFVVSEAELEIEAYVEKGDAAVHRDSETFIECFLSGTGKDGESYVRRQVTIEDAKLSDLPLIALALQGALTVGVRDGSFPALPGVPAK